MKLKRTFPASALFLLVSPLLGGTVATPATELTSTSEDKKWEFSLSTSAYFNREVSDFVNPILTVNRDWLHFEARYNYEALHTGSLWLGCNFSFGEKLTFDITPMVGGIFGDIGGVAPGYQITIAYKAFELFTQGEYFFDDTTRDNNFFYTWSELSYRPIEWFKFGLVVDRTKVLGSDIDIRRGPFIGFTYKHIDLTTYWLSPDSRNESVIVSVTLNF